MAYNFTSACKYAVPKQHNVSVPEKYVLNTLFRCHCPSDNISWTSKYKIKTSKCFCDVRYDCSVPLRKYKIKTFVRETCSINLFLWIQQNFENKRPSGWAYNGIWSVNVTRDVYLHARCLINWHDISVIYALHFYANTL